MQVGFFQHFVFKFWWEFIADHFYTKNYVNKFVSILKKNYFYERKVLFYKRIIALIKNFKLRSWTKLQHFLF